jgi:hypothetical protein
MRHNRSRFRVGTWRAALLVTLVLTGVSVTRASATIAPIQDPTQPSTENIEIVALDSPPAQGPLAPGTAELVAALPPFTIQHFPPDVLLSAPNPANGEDAVQEAEKCAPDVPVTPTLVPLPRNSFDAAQDVVQTAEEQFKCLEDIEVEEAKETDTINVDTQSEPQDLIGVNEPIAVDPTQGAPDVEETPVPPEVQAAADAAEAANQEEVVDPGQESGPVFTPIVPEGPGCPAVQDEVLDLRTNKTSVEAELEVVEIILQECEQSPSSTATATAQPPSPTATATARRAAHTATHSPHSAAHRSGDTSQQPAAQRAGHALRRPAAHHAGHRARRPAAHRSGQPSRRSAAHHTGHRAWPQVQ